MDYFDRLEADTHHLYEIANEARSKGLDVETETEVPLAKDLAERVEGLVGPEGVANRIKKLEEDMDRESVAFEIAAEIASGKFELTGEKADWDQEQRCDQGLRTALAILTEGVVAAPLEGISAVKIKDNFDGTKYIGVYFAGPIRSAGGTAAALSVLLGDKIRRAINIDAFKPIEDEIERYVEEVELYESEVTNLQYSPTPEEVRFAANNIPVEVSGEQTDQVEVSHRDLERVETNNIRGGALLAMVEGVIQKSKKIHKISKKLGLDWEWLTEYSKPKKDDSKGSDDITHTFHDFVRNHLLRKLPEEKRKCILLNSWEGNMFDFNTEKILSFLKKGKEMGIDLFVLDDGWFRNDDTYGLGDWNVDQRKIDLHKVIDEAHQLGIRFGLWIEPEQISFASHLYEENEDFALYDHSLQKPTTLRHQFVLDLTNEKARDTVFAEISRIFDEYRLDYCKWDFNRMLTEAHSSTYQKKYGSIFHQFVMGSYDLLDRFVKRYPNVILETCSGGGGRFDFGMLYYSHQIWASDETDVIPRSEIQYSTNLFYPMQCIGAHISARKLLSISEKGALAMFGTFGYELNPLLLNQNDMEEVHLANKRFLENYDIIMKGDYYPLLNPFEGNFIAWEMVNKEKDNAVVYFMNYRHINWRARFIKLRGLDPNKQYHNNLDNLYHSGAYYEQIGLNLSVGMPSFTPQIIELRAK